MVVSKCYFLCGKWPTMRSNKVIRKILRSCTKTQFYYRKDVPRLQLGIFERFRERRISKSVPQLRLG